MKKKLPTHDDKPSVKPQPKVVKTQAPNYEGEVAESKHSDGEKGTPLAPKVVETQAPNYEGQVREGKYEVEEHISIHTDTQPRSKSGEPYPFPHDDIDLYAVDTRIWDRLDGMGGDAGPHTHSNYALTTHEHDYLTELPTHDHPHTHSEYLTDLPTHDHPHDHDGDYADKQTLADHLANHPTGDGSGGSYDDTELRGRVGQNETDIASLGSDLTSAEQNIQANTEAIAGKADDPHEHPIQVHYHDYDGNLVDGGDFTPHNHNGVYQPVGDYADATHTHDTTHDHDGTYQPAGDYATKTELSTGLAGKSDTTHSHPEYEGGGGGGGSVGAGWYFGKPSTNDIKGTLAVMFDGFSYATDPTGSYFLKIFEANNANWGHIPIGGFASKGLGFLEAPEWKDGAQVRQGINSIQWKAELPVEAVEQADEQTISRIQRCYDAYGNSYGYSVRFAFRRPDFPETWIAGFHNETETRYANCHVFHLPVLGRGGGGGIPVETHFDEEEWERYLEEKEAEQDG